MGGECVCTCDSTTEVLDDTIDFGDDNYLSPTPSPVPAGTTPSPVAATDEDDVDDGAADDGLNKAWTLELCVEYCTLQYKGTHLCETTAADAWAVDNMLCSGGRRSAAPTIALWSAFLVPAML